VGEYLEFLQARGCQPAEFQKAAALAVMLNRYLSNLVEVYALAREDVPRAQKVFKDAEVQLAIIQPQLVSMACRVKGARVR
jgi:hypothetical protein